MRVAVVAADLHLADRQGLDRTWALAAALADRGHEVRAFCTQWWDGYDRTRVRDWVACEAVTVAPARSSFVARLPTVVARWRPDVVHVAPSPPTAVLAARAAATLSRARLVADWYGDEPVEDERFVRPATRAPDVLVCPSRYVELGVLAAGAPDDSTCVLPEFVDFDRIESVDPEPDAPDLVAGRRLDEAANLESLFLALAQHRDRDWTLTVFGDGPARGEFEAQVADLRIEDRVTFAGAVDRAERIAAYRGAHAFVHTATLEYFPTELLWALACGCAGVVEYQKDSAAHELVERRPRGFRATSSEEVEEAILEAADLPHLTVDDDLREFDRPNVLERLLELYRGD